MNLSSGEAQGAKAMTLEGSKFAKTKAKLAHEFKEALWLTAYFGLFFFAFATYKMLILHQFRSARFIYVTALINSLVLAKVMLLGGFVPLGKVMEHRPVVHSAIYKAAFFAILVAIFHFVEEFVKDAFRGHGIAEAFHATVKTTSIPLAGLTVICFCLFIPFFVTWEIRRIMGEKEFTELLLHGPHTRAALSR